MSDQPSHSSKHPVPKEFQPYLQTADIEEFDALENKRFIIQTFFHNASLKAWQWMWNTYSKSDIVEVLKTSRDLNERDATFWSYYLQVPPAEIRCLQPGFQATRKMYWPY